MRGDGPWHEHFGKGRGQVRSLDGTEPLRSCNEIEGREAPSIGAGPRFLVQRIRHEAHPDNLATLAP